MSKKTIDISIVIPFLNEESSINRLLNELEIFCKKMPSINVQVILIEDGSKDNSSEIIKSYDISNYMIKLIILSRNFGSHSALRAGILHSDGKYITSIAADLQDPLNVISNLYDKCTSEDIDLIWAKREKYKVSAITKIFSKLYWAIIRKYVSNDIPENGYDVFMFNEKVKIVLNNNIESNSSLHIQILSFGFKQNYIYYHKVERKSGKSKWTLSKKIKLLIDSFVAFSYAPIRFVSFIGIMFFITGFSWSFYIILRKLIYNDLASGWPALISTLLLGFGITNISLGIIAEYLWRTLDASRRRPVFIIDEIIELNKNNAK